VDYYSFDFFGYEEFIFEKKIVSLSFLQKNRTLQRAMILDNL